MILTRYFPSVVLCLMAAGILSGCTVHHKVTLRSELRTPLSTGPLTVLMKDKTVLKLDSYFLQDSVLFATGTRKVDSRDERFEGELRLSDIGYIQSNETSFMKLLMTTTAVGLVLATATSSSMNTDGLSVYPVVRYRVYGGGSCPFVSSWNGKSYVLEAEAFGIAFGRGLELETWSTLPSLNVDGSQLRIRISDERPETHYVNSVRLLTAETDTEAEAYLDQENRLWPSYDAVSPVSAMNGDRTGVLDALRKRDGFFWESDLSEGDFKDVIDLTFVVPPGAGDVSLIVHGINTHFSEEVFRQIFGLLGDRSLEFMDAVEHDPELIAALKGWIRESSLKVYIETPNGWEYEGAIEPEANAVPFSRLLRFNPAGRTGDTLRIRLVALADVWKLDAVEADWTPVLPLAAREIPLSAAVSSDADVRQSLLSADDRYVTLLPSDMIDLSFETPRYHPNKKRVFAIGVQGYLYEGIPKDGGGKQGSFAVSASSQTAVEVVKHLIQHRSLLLPPVYAAWKAAKQQ